MFEKILGWVKAWDYKAILYSIIAAIIVAIFAGWFGLIGIISRKLRSHSGLNRYKKNLEKECSSLIVIGRKQGFSLNDVFVKLDIAPSDLATKTDETYSRSPKNFVLVGAPGAGKSTYVKRVVLDKLKEGNDGCPFLIRLREFGDSISIEAHIIEKLKSYGIQEADLFFRSHLNNRNSVVVLDGLDEVRPVQKNDICQMINGFYGKYFRNDICARLIITCRKEAFRDIPLDIPAIWEVRPLSDIQIKRFSEKWPIAYPNGKDSESFFRELQSTKRILDLVRSPLLLVGGLMQYTESNLGIPEERIEYLARIAKWLVSDWAVAQGHPNDPYRSVYERLLSRLAYAMHVSNSTEHISHDVVVLFAKWLPDFGIQSEEASLVFDNLMVRTGILVRDTPGASVFSQFALQEYYASIEINQVLSINEVANLNPKPWWREVTLLSIAQKKDPTRALVALFETDPILGASAVGECPTPSIVMQEKAISACLAGIDNKDLSANLATTTLLRKVSGLQIIQLCNELEKRLMHDESSSEAISGILAKSDTQEATIVISKYPELWQTCLNHIGYLSNSFENLLIDWVANHPDKNWDLATQLIVSNLTEDRFKQLVDMLGKLPTDRAELLSIYLMGYIVKQEPHVFVISKDSLAKISKCAVFVSDMQKYKSLSQSSERDFGMESVAQTAIFLKKEKSDISPDTIQSLLEGSMNWAQRRSAFISWIASGVCVLGLFFHSWEGRVVVVCSVIIFLLAIFNEEMSFPWGSNISFGLGRFSPLQGLCLLIGGIAILTIGGTFIRELNSVKMFPLLILVFLLALVGQLLYKTNRFYMEVQPPFWKDHFSLGSFIWLVISASLCAFSLFWPSVTRCVAVVFGLVFSVYQFFFAIRFFYQWNTVRLTNKRMKKLFPFF